MSLLRILTVVTIEPKMSNLLFSGRLNRKEYFLGLVFSFFAIILLGIVCGVLINISSGVTSNNTWVGIAIALSLFPLTVKRLHDINHSGWWAVLLLPFAPFVLLFLLIIEGKRDTNIYGQPVGDRRISLRGITLNMWPVQEIVTTPEQFVAQASPAPQSTSRTTFLSRFKRQSAPEKIPLLSVLAISPLGIVVPYIFLSIVGLCTGALGSGIKCSIPVLSGYFETVAGFWEISFIMFGLGIVWLFVAIYVWLLLVVSILRKGYGLLRG